MMIRTRGVPKSFSCIQYRRRRVSSVELRADVVREAEEEVVWFVPGLGTRDAKLNGALQKHGPPVTREHVTPNCGSTLY